MSLLQKAEEVILQTESVFEQGGTLVAICVYKRYHVLLSGCWNWTHAMVKNNKRGRNRGCLWRRQLPWHNYGLCLVCVSFFNSGRTKRTKTRHKIWNHACSVSRRPTACLGPVRADRVERPPSLLVVPDKDRNSISSMRASADRFTSYELMCNPQSLLIYLSETQRGQPRRPRQEQPVPAAVMIHSTPPR